MRFTSDRKTAWLLVSAGAAALAASVTERALAGAWRSVRHEEPPFEREIQDGNWGGPVVWTAVAGAAIGVATLLARKGAAVGWRTVTGHRPPKMSS